MCVEMASYGEAADNVKDSRKNSLHMSTRRAPEAAVVGARNLQEMKKNCVYPCNTSRCVATEINANLIYFKEIQKASFRSLADARIFRDGHYNKASQAENGGQNI